MFALLLIKFNRLAIRTRLIGGLSVGLVFILLAAFSAYAVFFFDDLSRYASENTEIYLHLDKRNAPDNFYSIKLADAMLAQFRLDDLDRHLAGSESAVLCDSYAGELACGLIIQTGQTEKFSQYLAAKHIIFRKLTGGTFIVGQNSDWLGTIKKSHNPFRFLKFQSTVGRYGALTIGISQPLILNDEISKTIHFSGAKSFAKFNGAITSQGIAIKTAGFADMFSFGNGQIKSSNGIDAACDLMVISDHGFDSDPLNASISGLFLNTASTTDLINQPFSFCANKINSTGNFIDDYDFILGSDQPIDSNGIVQLERILLNLASKSQPSVKKYYLDDGTKISELFSNPDGLTFESATSSKRIRLSESKTLFYSNSSSGGLIVSNKIGLIMPNNRPDNKNYLSLRISSLPDSPTKEILSDFSYLSAIDGQAVIR